MKRLSFFLLLLVFSFFAKTAYCGSGSPTPQDVSTTTNRQDLPPTSYNTGNAIDWAHSSTSVSSAHDRNNPAESALELCVAAGGNPVLCAIFTGWNSYNGAPAGFTTTYTGSGYTYLGTTSVTTDPLVNTIKTNANGDIKTLAGSEITPKLFVNYVNQYQLTTANTAHYGRTDYYSRVDHYYADPLILDLDGTGVPDVPNHVWLPHVPLFHREGAVVFDISGDGTPILMEWLGPHSGLLCVPDKNGNVTSAKEIFGTYGGFDSGYEKLSLRDKNHDGKIEGDELKGLYIWRDLNGNGKVDPGELISVQDLGITSISLNQHNYESTYVRNGKTYKTWDWWPSGMRLAPAPNANKL